MSRASLDITFRKGKFLAAYLRLPRQAGDASSGVEETPDGYLIERALDGRPIGIEITSIKQFTPSGLNTVLARLDLPPLDSSELWPLRVARKVAIDPENAALIEKLMLP